MRARRSDRMVGTMTRFPVPVGPELYPIRHVIESVVHYVQPAPFISEGQVVILFER